MSNLSLAVNLYIWDFLNDIYINTYCRKTIYFLSIIFSVLSLILMEYPALAVEKVRLYNVFEIEIINTKAYLNPFNFDEIKLECNFTSPSKKIDYFGFYDGDGKGGQNGHVWKIRFMPDEVGGWRYQYSWTDGTLGASGEFVVISSFNKGPLKRDPVHPHHVIYSNGEHFFWNGDSEWFFLSDLYSQQDRLEAIDFLARKNVNNFFMAMINDDKYDVYPWLGTADSLDKSRFNLEKLMRWEAVIKKMREVDIIADLLFYSDDSKRFYLSPGSPQEDLYFKYIIARFAAYSNVTWNLGIEFQEYRSKSWAEARAKFIKQNDPFDHLLSVHQLPSDFYAFPGNPHLDHTSLQRLRANHKTLNSTILINRKATTDAGFPIPIMHEEFFIEGIDGNLNQFRHGIWAITMAGGYYKAASLGWWIGPQYKNAGHFDIAKRLYDFITKIRYWEMVPDNNIVSSGYALVNSSEKEIIIYLPLGGDVNVDLSLAPGNLSVEWYNPITGKYAEQGITIGGGPAAFTTPFNGDAVLHIYAP